MPGCTRPLIRVEYYLPLVEMHTLRRSRDAVVTSREVTSCEPVASPTTAVTHGAPSVLAVPGLPFLRTSRVGPKVLEMFAKLGRHAL